MFTPRPLVVAGFAKARISEYLVRAPPPFGPRRIPVANRESAARGAAGVREAPDAGAPALTVSGRPLDSVVAPEGAPLPGEYPYTRGIHPEMYRTRLWTMRMFAGFGSPEDTNARFRALLGRGPDRALDGLRHAQPHGLRPGSPAVRGRGRPRGRLRRLGRRHAPPVRRASTWARVSTSLTISGPGAGGPGHVRGRRRGVRRAARAAARAPSRRTSSRSSSPRRSGSAPSGRPCAWSAT